MVSSTSISSTFDLAVTSQAFNIPMFIANSFPSTAAYIEAMLQFIAAQVGMRSGFLTEVDLAQNRNTIRSVYNAPDGCSIPLGAQLPLDHTF